MVLGELGLLTQEEEEECGGLHRYLTPVQQGLSSLNAQRFYPDSQDGINIYITRLLIFWSCFKVLFEFRSDVWIDRYTVCKMYL